jgi:hypothetical protein
MLTSKQHALMVKKTTLPAAAIIKMYAFSKGGGKF